MDFLKRRRMRKMARETLRHARHFRNMREDVMKASDLRTLAEKEEAVGAALRAGEHDGLEARVEDLFRCVGALAPKRTSPGLRENLEIAVVAIAIAMGFRTYFIQPFKIPTGSMQPTLYGIQAVARERQWSDRLPFNLVKWMVFGEWYLNVEAKTSGYVTMDRARSEADPSYTHFFIGNTRHKVPKVAKVRLNENSYIAAGTLIWRGVKTAGDHVFVDKVRWNFMRPKRGRIVVFGTDGIDGLPPKTHYIKRLIGLPGETISIDEPYVVVNGVKVEEPDTIGRVARKAPGYEGYQLVNWLGSRYDKALLCRPEDAFPLGPKDYFALGDNTGNSRDSRYWGAIPRKNLVGPSLLVYWPFSSRWGYTP